jgi:hypothetical protein
MMKYTRKVTSTAKPIIFSMLRSNFCGAIIPQSRAALMADLAALVSAKLMAAREM